MGLLAEDMAFISNIPVPVDITVAVVYSVFGEFILQDFKIIMSFFFPNDILGTETNNRVNNVVNKFSARSSSVAIKHSMREDNTL